MESPTNLTFVALDPGRTRASFQMVRYGIWETLPDSPLPVALAPPGRPEDVLAFEAWPNRVTVMLTGGVH